MNVEIKEVETSEEAVEQGAQLLDQTMPGWEKTVHGAMTEGLFNMNLWHACMAGTLELYHTAGEWEERISFNGLSFPAHSNESHYVGFLPLGGSDNESYKELDRLWREQVERRIS